MPRDGDIFPFLDEITPAGDARYVACSDPPYRRAFWVGRDRATRAIAEGPRVHNLSVSLRGRSRSERVGDSALLDFGPAELGDPLDFPSLRSPLASSTTTRSRTRACRSDDVSGRWQDSGG